MKNMRFDVTRKEAMIWFISSLVGVFLVLSLVIHRTGTALFAETIGYALVFVMLMIGTRIYSHFIEDHYLVRFRKK